MVHIVVYGWFYLSLLSGVISFGEEIRGWVCFLWKMELSTEISGFLKEGMEVLSL
jgi:hypothetical protein